MPLFEWRGYVKYKYSQVLQGSQWYLSRQGILNSGVIPFYVYGVLNSINMIGISIVRFYAFRSDAGGASEEKERGKRQNRKQECLQKEVHVPSGEPKREEEKSNPG